VRLFVYPVHFEPASSRFLHRPTGQVWLHTPGGTPSICGGECSSAWCRLPRAMPREMQPSCRTFGQKNYACMAAGDGGPRWMVTYRRHQIHANMPFNWSVAAFPPRLNVLGAKLGFQSAAVRSVSDGHIGFKDASADYAGPNEPGARWWLRQRRRRQRQRRPPVSTYTSSTEGVTA